MTHQIDHTIHKYNAGIHGLGVIGSMSLFVLFPPQRGSDVTNTYLFDDGPMQMLLYSGALMLTMGSLFNAREVRKENENRSGTETKSSFKHLTGTGIALSMIGIALLSCAVLYAFDVAFLKGDIFNAPRSNAGPETTSQKLIFSAIYAGISVATAASTYAQVKLGKTLLKGPG